MGSSLGSQMVFLFVFFYVSFTKVQSQVKEFNVMAYNARADGKTDDSKAFLSAWNDACKWKGSSRVLVPLGTYKMLKVIFEGPCNGPIQFLLKGTLTASTEYSSLNTDTWVAFRQVDQLTLNGDGSLNGQGQSAWRYNDCQTKSSCIRLPANIRFDFVTNSYINHINSLDSKNLHMNLFACKDVEIHNLNIKAPALSPNTDGIHIGKSSGIKIYDSFIGTGDDCISMSPGSVNISVWNVNCGPGHGISVGSMGGRPNEDPVSGVNVTNCTFSGTDNGLRIKTWAPSYPGKIYGITFQDIIIDKVNNPIVIDQQYCPSRKCDQKAASEVEISDVKFKNVRGTSRLKLAVKLLCSSKYPCEKVELTDINLVYKGKGGPAISSCSNVQSVAYGIQNPRSCV